MTTGAPWMLLGEPAAAIAAGLFAGVACLVASRFSVRVMRPDHPVSGVVLTFGLLFVRFAFSVAVLAACKAIAPEVFTTFAGAYVGGFLVAYNYELLQFSGLLRRLSWQRGR
jgi:hypothetical protein